MTEPDLTSGSDQSRVIILPASCLQAATAVYEEAVQTLPTTRMYDLYAAFLRERVDEATELAVTAGGAKDARKRAAALTLALLRLYSRAADAGIS